MENIEVTKETFFSVFTSEESVAILVKEQYEKITYYSKEKEQVGYAMWHFASSKVSQYYLRDINA